MKQSTSEMTVVNAARLIYKATDSGSVPNNDTQYRELVALYRAEPTFSALVREVAEGFQLLILDASERGLVVAPKSRESRFAVRLSDLRSSLKGAEQKTPLLLAHVAIIAVFFPTTDSLDDESYIPPPVSVAQCRDALHSLAQRLKLAPGEDPDIPPELASGRDALAALPLAVPSGKRAAPNSIVGFVQLALSHMRASNLVRSDRNSDDDVAQTYTATHRLRVQVQALTLRRLYELAQSAIAAPR